MTARFIVFEGGEGSGKSTQAGRLASRLGAVLTREPGGTDVGVQLREVLLAVAEYDVALTDRSEALLMAADRAQHVATVVRPALAAGRHVVSDRYIPSTIAYQGAGRGLDAAADIVPDILPDAPRLLRDLLPHIHVRGWCLTKMTGFPIPESRQRFRSTEHLKLMRP